MLHLEMPTLKSGSKNAQATMWAISYVVRSISNWIVLIILNIFDFVYGDGKRNIYDSDRFACPLVCV